MNNPQAFGNELSHIFSDGKNAELKTSKNDKKLIFQAPKIKKKKKISHKNMLFCYT